MIFKDSLGFTHHLHEPLLKAGIPEPPPGAFRALIDDLAALRDRRSRLAERVKAPTIRQRPAKPAPARPAKPAAKPLRKSLADLARDAQRRTEEIQRQTEAIQRRTARALIDDLSAQARAGRLGAIQAAKLDALAHRHARDLGMETTGVRR